MRVGDPCLSLVDLVLHRPPYTSFGTGSCRSVFVVPGPVPARSFDQGWLHRELVGMSKSQCATLAGGLVLHVCVQQAFALFG